MTAPGSTKSPSPVTTLLQGWVHQGNVTLLIAFIAIIAALLLVLRYILPIQLEFGLVAAGVLLLTFVGLAIVAGWHVTRMDSTEALTLQINDLILRAQSPSIAFVQIVQLLSRAAQRPDAIIPPGVDPKDDPAKFKKLTDSDETLVIAKELGKVLGRESVPTSDTPAVASDGTASIPPK